MSDKKCSEIFEDAFSSHGSGCVRDCVCGRTHFDTYNTYDWEDGELEDLEKKAKENPDKYIEHDHSIGMLIVDGQEFVFECPCNGAAKYERFILRHERQIADYLNKRADELTKHATEIHVNLPNWGWRSCPAGTLAVFDDKKIP
jgi:hypothetical protein